MFILMKPYKLAFTVLVPLSALLLTASLYLTFISSTFIIMWEITPIFNSYIYFPIILDPKGLLFSSVVLFISANVMNFAETYMSHEQFNTRFISLVLLFVLSMNMLIFFPHLMTLLLGWDGLGLTSFVLVIYYQNSKSLGAGMITALTNRIGDALLLLAIGWLLNTNNWMITLMWDSPLNKMIITSITVAAMTKSAQVPFSSWLPAAMAAPTPVSALVHSSTLVTAGVFLLIRFHDFLSSFKMFNTLILFTASITMVMAGLSALTECDLKKVIALSTLSQLGVMMASLGLNAPNLAFFHLITHALFKALLFICAGSIIHFSHHGQDLRNVGNLAPQLPFTTSSLLIANMSLCGLPFLSGFYSKDLILETSMFNSTNWLILFMLFIATMLTMAYSFRLMLNSIWGPPSFTPSHFINNSDSNIITPAFLLTMGAIIAGSMISWQMTPMVQEIFVPLYFKLSPLMVTIFAILLIWHLTPLTSSTNSSALSSPMLHHASCSMWFLTPISTQNALYFPLSISHSFQKNLDQGWMEMMTAQGLFETSSSLSQTLLLSQKNHVMILIYLSFIPPITLFLIIMFLH